MSKTIKISGVGCALVDYLYMPDDFSNQAMKPYLSVRQTKTGKYKQENRNTPFTDALSNHDFENGNWKITFVDNIGTVWQLLPEFKNKSILRRDVSFKMEYSQTIIT